MIFRALERANRFAERVLLAAIGVLCAALLLALAAVFATGWQPEGQTGGRPVAAREPATGSTPDAPGNPGGGEDVAATQGGDGRGRTPSATGSSAGGGPTEYLCAPLGELLYLRGDGVGVAADDGGHFGFYGLPEADGRPSRDSHDLLRDCSADLSHANLAHVEVRGPLATDVDVLGNGRQAGDTRREADGSLVTVHEPSQGLRVTQRLRLVEGEQGRREALLVSYELENYTDEPAPELENLENERLVVSLSSTLAPPLAVVDRGSFGDPSGALFELRGSDGARAETAFDGSEIPAQLGAPRPGAASDSSGVWSRGPEGTGPPPDRLVVAGWLGLAADPLGYRPDPGTTLPQNAAVSAQWKNLALEPGETVTVSHTYAPGYAASD